MNNRPLLNSYNSHLQNEAKCKTFLVKSYICLRIKNHFHMNSFALSLALKQRLGVTRKWSIDERMKSSISQLTDQHLGSTCKLS